MSAAEVEGPSTSTFISLRERDLLIEENEYLREELRVLREKLTPHEMRWGRLNLSITSALLLDMLWDGAERRPIAKHQMLMRLNFVRLKEKKKPLTDINCINVYMFRLRKSLKTKAKMQPIASIVGHGYILKEGSRPILEKWKI